MDLRAPPWAASEYARAETTRLEVRMPRGVYVQEARELATFAREHRRELEGSLLPKETPEQMDWLCEQISLCTPTAQRLRSREQVQARDELQEIRDFIPEFHQLMTFYAQRTGNDDLLVTLGRFAADRRRNGKSRESLRNGLYNLVGTAGGHPSLIGIGGMTEERFQRAVELAKKTVDEGGPDFVRDARSHRERCFRLLDARVRLVRDTARLVFRRQPEHLKEMRSSWEAQRRARIRAKKAPSADEVE